MPVLFRLVCLALESINLLCQPGVFALALWHYFQCNSELYPCIRSHAHTQFSCCDAWEELPYCAEAGNQLVVWWYCTLARILNDQNCPALSGNHGVLWISPARSVCCPALDSKDSLRYWLALGLGSCCGLRLGPSATLHFYQIFLPLSPGCYSNITQFQLRVGLPLYDYSPRSWEDTLDISL